MKQLRGIAPGYGSEANIAAAQEQRSMLGVMAERRRREEAEDLALAAWNPRPQPIMPATLHAVFATDEEIDQLARKLVWGE